MEFQTKVILPEKELEITHCDLLLVMGSCFTEHIGLWLKDNKFSCTVNPYGVLYNPISLLQALNEMSAGKVYGKDEVFFHNGVWNSWMHHSSFSSPDRDVLLNTINQTNKYIQDKISHLQLLILTWGTNHVYRNKATGQFVGNCHKMPADNFEEVKFTTKEIVSSYAAWIENHPHVKILFTVSPIRYKKYGFHENNLSKATLLLAQAELVQRFKGRCFYFPSYEILMDELRDYRFYAEDMVHPSETAIRYIEECFSKCYFSLETQTINKECERIVKALKHRPIHPDTDVYQCFLSKIVLRIQEIKEKYPYLSNKFETEIRLCHTLLKK